MSVIFGDGARDTERIRLTIPDNVAVCDSIHSLVAYLAENEDEDLVVVGPDVLLSVATDLSEKYRLERPSLGVILLRRRIELQTMTEALRAGIREVVASDDAEALLSAFQRSQSIARQLRQTERRPGDAGVGKLILVFSAKGGSGKTTLATNAAEAFASLDIGNVCLVDFNLTFGDVAIALQIDPTKTISDALGMQGGLDKQGVASLVIPYKERFDVLLAPTQPADAEFISAALVGEVLNLLRDMYSFVIIDSPPVFNDVVLKCFDLADSYLLLSTLDMLSLKNLKVAADTLDALGYPRTRWNIVLNRCDSKVGLTNDDFEYALGVPIKVKLPSSKDVPASLNKGVTLVADMPKHPFSRAVLEYAQMEADLAAEVAEHTPKPKAHLFRRLGGGT
jgi:pilus assembly protein CpaE